MIGKVRYVGKDFGFSLKNGGVYDCFSIEDGMLRIIDDESKEDDYGIYPPGYLYNPDIAGDLMAGSDEVGIWEIVEDPDGKIEELFTRMNG